MIDFAEEDKKRHENFKSCGLIPEEWGEISARMEKKKRWKRFRVDIGKDKKETDGWGNPIRGNRHLSPRDENFRRPCAIHYPFSIKPFDPSQPDSPCQKVTPLEK